MDGLMAPVDLPFLQVYTSDGKQFCYYRRAGRRTRLHGQPGSPEFIAAYQAAHAAAEGALPRRKPDAPRTPQTGTLGELVERFKASADFRQLAPATQRDYAWLLTPLIKRAGDRPIALMERDWIKRRQAELVEKPRTANYMVSVMRRVLQFGVDENIGGLKVNVAERIKPLITGPGHRVWTDAEITAMTSKAAGDVALPVLIGLNTAQRLSDVLRMVWTAYDGQTVTMIQGKTRTKVIIPVHPDLKAVLDATPRIAAVICTTSTGRVWTRDHFEHRFRAIRTTLKLADDVHFHGLRHTQSSNLAEAGASDGEIQSLTGHKSRVMVEHYTRAANRLKMATAGIARLPSRKKDD